MTTEEVRDQQQAQDEKVNEAEPEKELTQEELDKVAGGSVSSGGDRPTES